MPLETLNFNSSGEPNAKIVVPAGGASAARSAGSSRLPLRAKTAMSVAGSAPWTVALRISPVSSWTSIDFAPRMTCSLVTMWPSSSQTQPDPLEISSRIPVRPRPSTNGASTIEVMCTTEGETCWVSKTPASLAILSGVSAGPSRSASTRALVRAYSTLAAKSGPSHSTNPVIPSVRYAGRTRRVPPMVSVHRRWFGTPRPPVGRPRFESRFGPWSPGAKRHQPWGGQSWAASG